MNPLYCGYTALRKQLRISANMTYALQQLLFIRLNRPVHLRPSCSWFTLPFSIIVFTTSGCDHPSHTEDSGLSQRSAMSTNMSGTNVEYTDDILNSIGMRFRSIEGKRFVMGSHSEALNSDDQKPAHPVILSYDFYMGIHEVTESVYRNVIENSVDHTPDELLSSHSVRKSDTNLPVRNVSWDQAMEFCRVLSMRAEERSANRIYRLPTEAEWEFCCSAGANTKFSFGEELAPKSAWFRFDHVATRPEKPKKVGSFKANQFGLHDMHGNVWEWCLDWYAEDYYRHSPERDPPGPENGSRRVIRGGGWNTKQEYCRSAFRDSKMPNEMSDYLGFRVVCLTGRYSPAMDLSNSTRTIQNRSADSTSARLPNIIATVEPSVVRINVQRATGFVHGSGFLFHNNTSVLTNYHVIEGAEAATVEFEDSVQRVVLGTVYEDPRRDLAVLKLNHPHPTSMPLQPYLRKLRKGEEVIAFGAPNGLSFSASTGIVSAVRSHRDLQSMGIDLGFKVTWVQNTAPISPGNSGGPLVNSQGQVIGVNTLISTGANTQNLNFAISASDLPLTESLANKVQPLDGKSSSVGETMKTFLDALHELEQHLEQ